MGYNHTVPNPGHKGARHPRICNRWRDEDCRSGHHKCAVNGDIQYRCIPRGVQQMLDKATGDKNWENFQTFLQDAQRKLCKKIQATTQKTSYHGINAMMPYGLDNTNEAIIIIAFTAVS